MWVEKMTSNQHISSCYTLLASYIVSKHTALTNTALIFFHILARNIPDLDRTCYFIHTESSVGTQTSLFNYNGHHTTI